MRTEKIAAALLLVGFAASVQAAAPTARGANDSRVYVTTVAGEVDVTMAGSPATVAPESTVMLPARIVTGADGALGLTQAGTNINVASDSDVEIPAEAVDGNLVARLVQHRGNVFYDVAKRDVGKLRVETPLLVAVIKGTQFNVAVDENGTTISLFEGHLEILTPDTNELVELDAGEIAIRTLVDDAIRVVGMDDVRLPAPTADARVAAAASTAPKDAADTTTVTVQGGAATTPAVTAADQGKVETPRNDVAVARGQASIALDEQKTAGGQAVVAAVDARVEARRLGVVLDIGGKGLDVELDADADVGRGHGRGVRDAAIDLGTEVTLDTAGAVDLGTTVDLDAGVDLGTGVDLSTAVDLRTAVDLDTTVDLGTTLDLVTIDFDTTVDLRDEVEDENEDGDGAVPDPEPPKLPGGLLRP